MERKIVRRCQVHENFYVEVEKTEYDYEAAYKFTLYEKSGCQMADLGVKTKSEIRSFYPTGDLRTLIPQIAKDLSQDYIDIFKELY